MRNTYRVSLIVACCFLLAQAASALPKGKHETGKGAGKDTAAAVVRDTVPKLPAQPAELFGIKIYPGAKLDTALTRYARQVLTPDVYCYRTRDGVLKVAAFFQGQPGLVSLGADSLGAMFTKDLGGSTVSITIANPWTDGRTGLPHSEDTLIQILKAQ